MLNVKVNGSTTTGAQALYDVVRKLPSSSQLNFALKDESKLKLISGMSDYELTCLSPNEFPILEDNIEEEPTVIDQSNF